MKPHRLTPHQSKMKKDAADIRGIPSQTDTRIRVIIDDRSNSERARQEALILSRFADTWLLTALQDTIARHGLVQH